MGAQIDKFDRKLSKIDPIFGAIKKQQNKLGLSLTKPVADLDREERASIKEQEKSFSRRRKAERSGSLLTRKA